MIEASTTVKGIKEAQRDLRLFRQAVSQGRSEPMKKIGEKALSVILKRTTSGNDINGNKFLPYTKKYATRKKTSFVDLELKGDMLDAVSFQSWAKRVRIYIKAGLQYIKGIVHNNGGRSGRGDGFAMPKREFMGVEREIDEVIEPARKWWYDYARKLGLIK